MRKLLSACWVHALNACLWFLTSTMFEMVCKISRNVSDRALKWTLSGGCSRHLSLGVRNVAPESTHFESYWASHPGVHSHQWGLWAILESLDKYSNKCSYLHMLANFYRLFLSTLCWHTLIKIFDLLMVTAYGFQAWGCWWWKCAIVGEGFPLIDIWPQHLWTVLGTRRIGIHSLFALICTWTHWFGTMMTTILLLIVSC